MLYEVITGPGARIVVALPALVARRPLAVGGPSLPGLVAKSILKLTP